jgi:hypothetical protein
MHADALVSARWRGMLTASALGLEQSACVACLCVHLYLRKGLVLVKASSMARTRSLDAVSEPLTFVYLLLTSFQADAYGLVENLLIH